MDVQVIPKLVGKIITQHSVPQGSLPCGGNGTSIQGYVHMTITCTGTFTIRGHAIVSAVPFVIDLTRTDGLAVLHPFQAPAPIYIEELLAVSEDMGNISDDSSLSEESHM